MKVIRAGASKKHLTLEMHLYLKRENYHYYPFQCKLSRRIGMQLFSHASYYFKGVAAGIPGQKKIPTWVGGPPSDSHGNSKFRMSKEGSLDI